MFSVIFFRAKPESLHKATGKSLSTVLSREILLHFELYELDTKEGTTTVHYGAALPVFLQSQGSRESVFNDRPRLPTAAPLWVADQSSILEPWSRVLPNMYWKTAHRGLSSSI